jgi:exosortase
VVENNRIRRGHALQISIGHQTQEHLLRLIVGALVLLTAWSYWPTITVLFKEWQRDADYSAGQLVPLVALFLLWRERKTLGGCLLKPCWWGGAALLILALAGRTYGLLFMFESAERYSLVLTIAGLVLMVAGWQVFRRVLWILLFLFLMVPLPGRVHNLISGPLQRFATTGAVFLLEALGVRVSQQGNVVMLGENTTMAVAEACSGLRMLMAFIIVAAFIAYMVKRSRWQKAVLLLSSIPVAVMCNIVRLFVTGVLMLLVSTQAGEKFFHDFAGLAMMPVAVLLMFGELWLMDKLTLPDAKPQQVHIRTQAKSATPTSAQTTKRQKHRAHR